MVALAEVFASINDDNWFILYVLSVKKVQHSTIILPISIAILEKIANTHSYKRLSTINACDNKYCFWPLL